MAPDDLDDSDARRMAELERGLRAAQRQRGEVRQQAESPPSKLGVAFRLVTELLAGVIVGGGIGWALDRYFGTAPILLIVMFLVGVAAGFFNVLRAARDMNQTDPPQGG